MEPSRLRHSQILLWAMLLLALIYGILIGLSPAPPGKDWLAGSLGVLLGLYICSHPAANAVDLIFFERGAIPRLFKAWPGIGYLALNLIVLLAGWLVIVVGTVRLTGRA